MFSRTKSLVSIGLAVVCFVSCDRSPQLADNKVASSAQVEHTSTTQRAQAPQQDQVVTVHTKALRNFFDAHYAEDYARAYQYVSARDKKIRNLDEYKMASSGGAAALISGDHVSYVVREVAEGENEAFVVIDLTMPDMEILFTSFMDVIADSSITPEQGRQKVAESLAKKYPDKQYPMTTINKRYKMVKEADGWKIFLNWEAGRYPGDKVKK